MRAFRDSLHEGFAARGLDRLFGSVRELVTASQEVQARGNTRQVEALLANPRVSGFLVTQLNDVAWEFHAGILDPWRNPKRTYHALERLNRPNCLILQASEAVVTSGDRIDVAVTLVQRVPSRAGRAGVGDRLRTRGTRARDGEPPRPTSGRGSRSWERCHSSSKMGPASIGSWRNCIRDEALLAESTETVLALPPPDRSDLPDSLLVDAHLAATMRSPRSYARRWGRPERAGCGAEARIAEPGRLGGAPGRGRCWWGRRDRAASP